MQPYFIWNNVDSRDMDVIVTSYPPIIRPPERAIQQTIPGRAGTLIITEGDDVYDSYIRTFVIGLKPGVPVNTVERWLRGSGTMIFGHESNFRYFGRILSAVQFDKVGAWRLKSAGVQMLCQPYKGRYPVESNITMSSSGYIDGMGNVKAKPLITVNGSGNMTFGFGGSYFTLLSAPTGLKIDSDAGIILTSGGAAWTGSWVGEFPQLAPGRTQIIIPSGVSLTITPNWRWI